jgi:low affinity Fe/Cu permease
VSHLAGGPPETAPGAARVGYGLLEHDARPEDVMGLAHDLKEKGKELLEAAQEKAEKAKEVVEEKAKGLKEAVEKKVEPPPK